MSARRVVGLVTLLATSQCLGAGFAAAREVQVDFSGHVSYDGGAADALAAQSSSLGWTVPEGSAFSGHFTLDDGVAPTAVQAPVAGESNYLFLSPDWLLETALGPLSTTNGPPPGPGYFAVEPAGDGYVITVDANGSFETVVDVGGQVRGSTAVGSLPDQLFFTLELRGTPTTPFTSTELAGVPWNVADYVSATATWTFEWNDGRYLEIRGPVDAVVPEPGVNALAAAALVGLAGRGFRRARG